MWGWLLNPLRKCGRYIQSWIGWAKECFKTLVSAFKIFLKLVYSYELAIRR